MGEIEAAAETARRWLLTRPDDHKARLEAVGRLQRLGRPEDALDVALQGVKRAPRSGDARVVLSSVLDAQGRTREALRELRSASRLFPDPINRGQAIHMMRATMAAAPESIRVIARRDSLEEVRIETELRERSK
jgi:tetratricopeptide (TPR) repeat protein